MKTCPKCGRALNDNDITCGFCGLNKPVKNMGGSYPPPYTVQAGLSYPVQGYSARPAYPAYQISPANPAYPAYPPRAAYSPYPVYPAYPGYGYGGYAAPMPPTQRAVRSKRRPGTLSALIWSLIMVAVLNPIGTPLAVIAAFFAAAAGDEDCDAEESRQKVKKSLILCIAATVIDVATAFYFILGFIYMYKTSHGMM